MVIFRHIIIIIDCQRKIKKIETQRRIFNIPFEDPKIIDVVFEILQLFFGHSIFTSNKYNCIYIIYKSFHLRHFLPCLGMNYCFSCHQKYIIAQITVAVVSIAVSGSCLKKVSPTSNKLHFIINVVACMIILMLKSGGSFYFLSNSSEKISILQERGWYRYWYTLTLHQL